MPHRILIVEDQPDICKLIRMTLEFGDFEIHEAHDGESALNMARATLPTVMLLDVMMPGLLDGYQVCSRIKQDPSLRGIQVVMLTARGQATDLAAGEAAGADAYLVKPFSPLELIERVEAMAAAASAATTTAISD
ncbi:response regulator receiver domain-containing protein [Aquabacterium commune]|uniref:Response regulator receiver domain-containing protein n=1 Tax=Aquabacterium commune TaxID=70586 RepID=A0A4R6RP51_9BURK|nr:response regulator [Aquabacterium commune]TDP88402.1 response regulator receiver domain-containing protein [Aquabacterium commune]